MPHFCFTELIAERDVEGAVPYMFYVSTAICSAVPRFPTRFDTSQTP